MGSKNGPQQSGAKQYVSSRKNTDGGVRRATGGSRKGKAKQEEVDYLEWNLPDRKNDT